MVRRLLLLFLLVAFIMALVAAPAMAVPGAPGPPGMMIGSYYRTAETGSDRVHFRAGGTLEDGYGFIRYDAWYAPFGHYYLDFEVTSFYRQSDTRAACYGVLKATDSGWPLEETTMVLWVEDNGEGAMAAMPDQWYWIYGPLSTYSSWWLTDWEYDLGAGLTPVAPLPITSGNIQVL